MCREGAFSGRWCKFKIKSTIKYVSTLSSYAKTIKSLKILKILNSLTPKKSVKTALEIARTMHVRPLWISVSMVAQTVDPGWSGTVHRPDFLVRGPDFSVRIPLVRSVSGFSKKYDKTEFQKTPDHGPDHGPDQEYPDRKIRINLFIRTSPDFWSDPSNHVR